MIMRLLVVSSLLALSLSASAADLRVQVSRNGFTGPIDVAIASRIEGAAPQWSTTKTLAASSTATFIGMAEGLYVVMVKGAQPLQRLSAKANLGANGATVRLAIPKGRTSLRVTLAGRPIARAAVELTHEELRWTTELQTNDDGRFEGSLWEPGAYDVAVWRDRRAAPHIVTVTLSAKPWTIDVPDRFVAGRVAGEDGKPVAGATVFLRTQDDVSTQTFHTSAGSDGRFEFFGVRQGSQSLTARAPSYLDSDAVAFELEGQSVRRSFDLALTHGVQRPVRVIDHRGDPVANASLLTACDGNLKSTAATNAEGRAQVALPRTGTCAIYAIPKDGSIAVSPVWGEEPLVLRVPEGSSSLRMSLAADNGVDFAGTWLLMRINGTIIPPAVARRLVTRGLRLVTDGEGTISLAHIPPGTYEFWPYSTDLEGQILYEGANTMSAPISLDIAAGDNSAKVRLRSRR
jgi:hypothetical protein